MENKKTRSNKKTSTCNSILEKGDFVIVNGELKLIDTYYEKRGKTKPNKK